MQDCKVSTYIEAATGAVLYQTRPDEMFITELLFISFSGSPAEQIM